MKRFWLLSGCAAIALSSASLWGQEDEVKVRVRAIATPEGKVEVVEETIEGDPKAGSEARRFRIVKEVLEEKQQEAGEQAEKKPTTIIRQNLNTLLGRVGQEVTETEEVAELPHSDYWIGIQLGDVAPEIRKHMAVKHGILVVHVYPESPAAKAELLADDVLIQAGDVKIETPADLIKAVDAAQTKELKLKLLREGAEKSLTVSPVKRPTEEAAELRMKVIDQDRMRAAERELQQALAKLQAANAERAALDFMLVRPGAYVHGEALKVPDNVSIQITKEGSKPAKVVVKQGDKTFEATEGKLDQLPKDLRPHVERLLSGGPSLLSVQRLPGNEQGQQFEWKVAPPVTSNKVAPRVVVPAVPMVPAVPAMPGVPHVMPAPVAPVAPGTAPVSPRVAWLQRSTIVDTAESKVDAKLEQILKKLDALGGSDLEEMKKELKALRKEVDALQKKASGSESSR